MTPHWWSPRQEHSALGLRDVVGTGDGVVVTGVWRTGAGAGSPSEEFAVITAAMTVAAAATSVAHTALSRPLRDRRTGRP